MKTQPTTPTRITKRFTRCALCGQVTSYKQKYCISCQRKLGEAGGTIAEEAQTALQIDTSLLVSEEVKVPRLGERLIEEGVLEPEMLEFALKVQAHRAESGAPVRLGPLLLELKLVSRPALDRVAMQQLLQTQRALEQSNQELERRVQESTHHLKNAVVKLSELSQMKADFVANLSHELRTPLAIMRGFAEMVGNQSLGALNPEQASAMSSLLHAGERMRKLVEDLLNFSEATQGAIRLQLEPLSLLRPADQAVQKVTQLANQRGVMLVKSLPEGLPRVRGDRQKLSWVLGEFLENAVKYTPAGGMVTLQAEARPEHVKVAVMDSGIGIPSQQLEEAFYPFHQLDGSTTRRQGGTGLGLALAQRIIEAHGSQIDVRSEEGRGRNLPSACHWPAEAAG